MKNIKISVIGLGYVGLPLAINFAKNDFTTFGIDKDPYKVSNLNKKKSYISSISNLEIKNIFKKNITFTNEYSLIKESKFIIICLPTPLKNNIPDLSYLFEAINQISKFIKKKQVIVLESTSYPGTSKLLANRLSILTGLKLEKDFFFGFSPERENPGGDLEYKKIPKVVSSFSQKSLTEIKNIYEKVFEKIIISKSVEETEAAKLLENCFRSVNIALINELRDLFNNTNLNIWRIIDIAKTKPFGFMPFYPSVGAGGHCIPIDPVYLSWYAKKNKTQTKLLNQSIVFNNSTSTKVAYYISKIIKNKKLSKNRLIIFGITYKKNVNDIRESASLKIFKSLFKNFNNVRYYDKNIEKINITKSKLTYSLKINELKNLKNYVSIITVNHDGINYTNILKNSVLVFDCVNKFKNNKKTISI